MEDLDLKKSIIINMVKYFSILICVIILTIFFKDDVSTILGKITRLDINGNIISFENSTTSFKGNLSADEMYYLIGSSKKGGVRYEDPDVKDSIDLLTEKGLINYTLEQNFAGENKAFTGIWAFPEPTDKGWELLWSMKISPKENIESIEKTIRKRKEILLVEAHLDWSTDDWEMSAISGVDSKGKITTYANCYQGAGCNVLLTSAELPIKEFHIETLHDVTSFITTRYEKNSFSREFIPRYISRYDCTKIEEDTMNVCILHVEH
ncbi:hypothetical protein [Vibrio sp. STUT-A11]|uniref:hypothetical protein n=1 Tax=Vibrio sp. STUT-A11 TaxID=2976236 RepID=UPI002230A97E|nr:hypothetical protein [Vibrio sp. STUT-A11]BDR16428.1 hypothetical protein VspSTUT11_44040 [Vibrio sp. STUT-A11]